MKIPFERTVEPFYEMPRFFGLAYRDFRRRCLVCYPIPFNIVVRITREMWWALKRGIFTGKYEMDIINAQARGYSEGLTERNEREFAISIKTRKEVK